MPTVTTPTANASQNCSWFRAMRSPEAMELLLAYPNAFTLVYVIAYRANFKDGFNANGLAPGEALLGDYREYGMSEQEYRTTKKQLEKWNFATFKATTKGTFARLIDSRVFRVSIIPANGQPTDRIDEKSNVKDSGAQKSTDRTTDRTTDGRAALRPIDSGACEASPVSSNGQRNGQSNTQLTDSQRTDPEKLTTNIDPCIDVLEGIDQSGKPSQPSSVKKGGKGVW